MNIEVGAYEHYKGGRYWVVGTATHTETGEEMVCYYGKDPNKMWVRPASMWNDVINGVPRFKKIKPTFCKVPHHTNAQTGTAMW